VERSLFFLIARQIEPITHALHISGEYFPKIFICTWGNCGTALTEKNVDRVGGALELRGNDSIREPRNVEDNGIGEKRAEMGKKGVGERFWGLGKCQWSRGVTITRMENLVGTT